MTMELRGNREGIKYSIKDIFHLAKIFGSKKRIGFYIVHSPKEIRRLKLTLRGIKIILKLLIKHGFSLFFLKVCSFNKIIIKNNILFLSHKHAVKVFLSKSNYCKHMRGVKYFKKYSSKSIGVNVIYDNDVFPVPHVKEKKLLPNTPTKNYSLSSMQIDCLVRFHTEKYKNIRCKFTKEEKSSIFKFFNNFNYNSIIIDKVISSDINYAFGYTHGDLTKGNVLIDGDKLIIIDWELFEKRRIAVDITSLLFWVNNKTLLSLIEVYNKKLNISRRKDLFQYQLMGCLLSKIPPINDGITQYYLNKYNYDQKRAINETRAYKEKIFNGIKYVETLI